MEDIWLNYAKRLHALASTGASFTKDRYDRERYDEVAQIAVEMMAQLGQVPIHRIKELVGPFATGYVTPKVDVRGVLFNGDTVLLVKEKSDGKWALPGGFADVGLTPAENVAKEIREEAGLNVDVKALIGVRHKQKSPSESDARDFYKLFFACKKICEAVEPHDPDIADCAYFGLNDIPELSAGRTILTDIVMAFDYRANTQRSPFFH